MNLLRDLNKQGVTVVVVTHNPEVGDYANKVLSVRDGEIHNKQVKK
jgi:putative ABC transport system ATP-binding protein